MSPDETGVDSTAASAESSDEETAASTTNGETGSDTEKESAHDGKPKGRPSEYYATRRKIEKLESLVEDLSSQLKTFGSRTENTDETEKQARDYIRREINEVMKELKQEEKKTNDQLLADFEDELEKVLEDNPELLEKDILDICEEDDVSPEIAARWLLRQKGVKKTDKPRLPSPSRGEPSGAPIPKIETKGITPYELARKLKETLLKK